MNVHKEKQKQRKKKRKRSDQQKYPMRMHATQTWSLNFRLDVCEIIFVDKHFDAFWGRRGQLEKLTSNSSKNVRGNVFILRGRVGVSDQGNLTEDRYREKSRTIRVGLVRHANDRKVKRKKKRSA